MNWRILQSKFSEKFQKSFLCSILKYKICQCQYPLCKVNNLESHKLMYACNLFKNFSDIASTVNHPIHIFKENATFTPSAFIPFCEFGGKMSRIGVRNDHFDVPVCNSFQAKILNDQLCYEVDLNHFSSQDNIEAEIKSGFIFVMDYNEDRQIKFGQDVKQIKTDDSFASRIVNSNDDKHAIIYLDTIGNVKESNT